MNQKLGVYTDNLDRYNQQYEELNQAYKNGEISQEAYIEGLNEINDGIYDNLENIQELDKEMMHYYGDTLAAAGEEIDKITTRMEHQTAVLEHY
jgi:chromosome segregation ATPase